MSGIILKAENISKQYRLGLVGTGTISHDLNRWWYRVRRKEDPYLKIGEVNDRSQKGNSDYVWALKDINFEVKHGEVLGIIGKNGAGKSTLLKILSRVTTPTTGEIKTKGRIASLLEVGTGFHAEMTGRENIYLNGAILGMTKKEISSKIDEIIEFSGCERYIDTPVKRYSSGMTVRLAFAVAAFLEPEILVIDEVLAVGDAEFQKKAIGKMQSISRGEGRTVLFVSHNMAAIKSLCTRSIVLEHGKVVFEGEVEDAIDHYILDKNRKNNKVFIGDKIIKKVFFKENIISYNEDLEIILNFISNIIIVNIVFGIVIRDERDVALVGVNNTHYKKDRLNKLPVKQGVIKLKINNIKLLPGKYYVDIFLGDSNKDLEVIEKAVDFKIRDNFNDETLSKINLSINKIYQNSVSWQIDNEK